MARNCKMVKPGEGFRLEGPACSATELAAILQSSDDAIFSRGLKGRILSWNRGAEKIYGYSAGEAVGKKITFISPPDCKHEVLRIPEKISRGQRVEHLKTMRLTKQGKAVHVSLTVSPISDKDGRITGCSATARDITLQQMMEEELRRSHDELEKRVMERTEQLWEKQLELEKSRDRYFNLYYFAPIGYVTLDGHGMIREIEKYAR